MKRTCVTVLAIAALALPAMAQESPAKLVAAYDNLATSILGLRAAERNFVGAILDNHYRTAKRAMKQEAWAEAAAEMALFATEGDNAVAGIRKRLVEGGHHHNAAGEQQGIYDEGYVLVTRKARKKVLETSAALRQATTAAAREQAWADFAALAEETLSAK